MDNTIEARCCYCILLMSCYWVAEVVPLAVTSFLPMIVLPFLGVMSIKTIAESYFTLDEKGTGDTELIAVYKQYLNFSFVTGYKHDVRY
uniref:ABC transmembrane type-1 domain-containing protein n=1 Tax=Heterorhabditis bacteriophora TaxID=37862 RepID=A0A1I7XQZ8_HETBA